MHSLKYFIKIDLKIKRALNKLKWAKETKILHKKMSKRQILGRKSTQEAVKNSRKVVNFKVSKVVSRKKRVKSVEKLTKK